MFYFCFSLDCSRETFLVKPQGTNFPCASGQQRESVLFWLQPCSSPLGPREAQHLRRTRMGVEQKVKHTRGKRQRQCLGQNPHEMVVEGEVFLNPHLTLILSLGCYNFLPFFPSGRLQRSHIGITTNSFKDARPWGRHSFCLGVR